MKHEMEENSGGYTQVPVDAETDAASKRGLESTGQERAGGRKRCGKASCEKPHDEAEASEQESREDILDECRKTCRRNFWTEMLKTIAKVAGVVLAAFGLSSFDQES